MSLFVYLAVFSPEFKFLRNLENGWDWTEVPNVMNKLRAQKLISILLYSGGHMGVILYKRYCQINLVVILTPRQTQTLDSQTMEIIYIYTLNYNIIKTPMKSYI